MRNERKIRQSSFTLMEMAIVVTIAGIIAAVAMVNYSTTIEKFRAKEGEETLITVVGAELRYGQEHHGIYTINMDALDVELRSSEYFNPPVLLVGGFMAQITRKDGSYTLSISNAEVITCSGGSSSLCPKLGY